MGLKQVGYREAGLILAKWASTTGDGRESDATGGQMAEPSEYNEQGRGRGVSGKE